jgi:hypothetical protein
MKKMNGRSSHSRYSRAENEEKRDRNRYYDASVGHFNFPIYGIFRANASASAGKADFERNSRLFQVIQRAIYWHTGASIPAFDAAFFEERLARNSFGFLTFAHLSDGRKAVIRLLFNIELSDFEFREPIDTFYDF